MAGLQRRGHTAIIYADDVLILGESLKAENRALNDAISLATELGITLNFSKSNLTPTSTIQYLGMLINLSTRTISLPPTKRSGLRDRCKYISRRATAPPRLAASLTGALLDAAKGAAPLLGLAQRLAAQAARAVRRTEWNRPVSTQDWTSTIQDIMNALQDNTPVPIPSTPTIIIETDASETG